LFFYETPEGFLIIMPKVNRPTLEKAVFSIRDFSEFDILLNFFEKVIKGISCMHKAGFVHADLKPDNIFVLPDFNPVIFDFNISHEINKKTSPKGTLSYITPEFLYSLDNKSEVEYKPNVDIYSLGIIFYYMMFQKNPYSSTRSFDELAKTRIHVPKNSKKIISKILRKTICLDKDRASLDDIENDIFRFRLNYVKEKSLSSDFEFVIGDDPKIGLDQIENHLMNLQNMLMSIVLCVFLCFK
jgi:serine/threonine protein kinase